MNVEQLIAELEIMDQDAEVMIAFQPSWPLESDIYTVVSTEDGVYIAASSGSNYLDSEARAELREEMWTD